MTDVDDDISEALARSAGQLPDLPGRWAGVQRRRRRGRHRRIASVAGVAVLVLAAGGTAVAVRHQGSGRATVFSAATVSPGGLVGGSGTVVAEPGKPVRFCDVNNYRWLTAAPAVGRPSADQPIPNCVGVDVVGVDLSRLTGRTVTGGIVSGTATLQGRYADGVLHVEHQQGYTPARKGADTGGGFDDHPPCPTPAGGWYRNGHTDNPDVRPAQEYGATHPTAIVEFAIARPSRTQSLILLLTEGDPAPVRAALSSSYAPDQICVARSAYTIAQVSAVQHDVDLQVRPPYVGPISSTGLGLDPATDQVVFQVGAVIETPTVAAAVARHPAGLVQVTAWLRPIGRSDPSTPPARTNASPSGTVTPNDTSLDAPPGSTDDHAESAPTGPVTTGLGDVDGDGRPDRVIVDADTATVSVHTASGKTTSLTLDTRGDRLEGVSDLAHAGRGLILIAVSASGCCGYTLSNARLIVVGLLDGHLVRFATTDGHDPLSYNDGDGNEVAGLSCPGGGIVTETHSGVLASTAATVTWTTTTYRLAGGTLTALSTREGSGSPTQLESLIRNNGCSGITADNRAA